ncbi:MAG TPA: putative glycoside hydrolase, partial [Gemmatimonadaceae bacterium]|nr:putative glycoside hydrolase [Gemmatimonadaceae bacterium]
GPASATAAATAPPEDSILQPKAPLVATPDPLRGLYVNRWQALGEAMWKLVDVAKTTEVNALVIDVKDDRGYVLYRSRVPLAVEIGADTNRPMSPARVRAVLDTMRAHRIYPIARIVVAKDPLLAERKLEWAIRRKDDPSKPWLDKNGKPWLDAHHPEVWKYAADLAKEAVDLGFSEVQFDYVRFPDEKRIASETVYPLANGRVRAQVIRDQLGYARGLLKDAGVPFTIDVFGLTTSDTTDMGIGQRWEMFVDQADVVLPMAYPSHYAPGSYHIGSPNAHPYQIIDHALDDARRRSAGITGAAKVIPWYQDFTLGPPHYTAEHVRAQMKAGYDNGVQSWILWNPRSDYTLSALSPEGR